MKTTKKNLLEMAETLKSEGCPDDMNIWFDIDRQKALNAARLWTDTVYWKCYECEATNEVYEGKRNDFTMSCEACYTVNQITVSHNIK